jgi:hypothetical protein
MKAFVFLVAAMIGLLWISAGLAWGTGFVLTSPDRPPIWFNRSGDKVEQDLSWDHARQELVLYVSYDQVQFIPEQDQTYYDTVRLAFPTVRLDESTNQLYFVGERGRKITIGHLESGVFGEHAVLNNDVQLSAHRRDGAVHAQIVHGPQR